MNTKLTNTEKHYAQFLLNTYQRANEISDEIDPKRTRILRYDRIAASAGDEFVALTGKHPAGLKMTDMAIPNGSFWS